MGIDNNSPNDLNVSQGRSAGAGASGAAYGQNQFDDLSGQQSGMHQATATDGGTTGGQYTTDPAAQQNQAGQGNQYSGEATDQTGGEGGQAEDSQGFTDQGEGQQGYGDQGRDPSFGGNEQEGGFSGGQSGFGSGVGGAAGGGESGGGRSMGGSGDYGQGSGQEESGSGYGNNAGTGNEGGLSGSDGSHAPGTSSAMGWSDAERGEDASVGQGGQQFGETTGGDTLGSVNGGQSGGFGGSGLTEHMHVHDADGNHVGTIDHIEGDRIKLTKNDSPDGHHHYLNASDIDTVEEGRAILRVGVNANSDV